MLKRAFTLIELLVVVAIVGVLATLLLPALARAKRQARLIQCKNNLRQLTIATQSYVGDNAAYPLYQFRYSWGATLTPYLGGESRAWPFIGWYPSSAPLPYQCPDDNAHAWGSYGYNWTGTQPWPDTLLWGEHEILLASARGLGGWAGRVESRLCLESSVKVPSEMIALGDGIYGGVWTSATGDPIGTVGTLGTDDRFSSGRKLDLESAIPKNVLKLARSAERERHRGRYNVAFCDGHLELIATEQLFSLQATAQRRWNADNEPH